MTSKVSSLWRQETVLLAALYILNVILRLPASLKLGLPPYLFCDEAMFAPKAFYAFAEHHYVITNEFKAGGFNIYPAILWGKFLSLFINLDYTEFLVAARVLYAVLLNPLALFFVYWSAKRLSPTRPLVPNIAALVFTVSPMVAGTSRQAYPDHYLIVFAAMFLYYLIEIYLSPRSWKPYVLAGVAAGLAISSKYTALLYAVPFASVLSLHLIPELRRSHRAEVLKEYAKRIGLCGAACCLILLLFNFSALLYPKVFWSDFLFNLNNYKRGHTGINLIGILYYVVVLFLLPFGLTGVPVLVLGFNRFFGERKLLACALLTFPIFLAVYLGGTAWITIDRNMIPGVPYLILFFSLGLAFLFEFVRNRARSAAAAYTILALFLAEPLGKTVYAFTRDLRTDSRVPARDWIRRNIAPGAKILHNEFCSGSSAAETGQFQTAFNDKVMFNASDDQEYDYYVFNSWWKGPLEYAFRRGMLLQPNHSQLHFYNITDREPLSLANNNKDYGQLEKGYEIVKEFDGSGPVVVVVRKSKLKTTP